MWKTNPHNQILKDDYKKYLKVLNRVIKDAKFKFEEKQIENSCKDPKKLWKFINTKIGKNKKTLNSIDFVIDEKNNKITDPDDIVESINDYFCTIGNKLQNTIKARKEEPLILPENNLNTIFINNTDEMEIINIVLKMKLKSGGVDAISTKILKVIINSIAFPLTRIFNNCIEQAIWPDALKKAEIIPIHKGKEKCKHENYRPISLISNIAKIFEKIIHKRLYNFIKKNNIISTSQFGFMKNIGTKDALCQLTKILNENMDKSIPSIVTFLDLAKAFDSVDHKILLQKLFRHGIRGKAYSLLVNYLQDRFQRVRINKIASNYKRIEIGVPQGTILGPLLFILYVNDLLLQMPKNSIMSYADDTAVITKCDEDDRNWKVAIDRMNILLDKVHKWLTANYLTLNLGKTVYMTFGSYCSSVPIKVEIFIDKVLLKRVESIKYLGIIFDYNLKWNAHINSIVNKTKYLIFIFYKLSKIMNTQILLKIYYAYFYGIINYGIIAWGAAYSSSLYPIQKLQNRIMKIISKKHFQIDNYPLRIDQVYLLESLYFYYEQFKNNFLESTSKTRKKNINLPSITKTSYRKSSYITGLKIFNFLPNNLKTLNTSTIGIKTKLKNWIRNNT